jgi:2-aminoethylphosphonate-pyruvate transaminase
MSNQEPYLLTPGPLTTSQETKEAMLRDWGSRDMAFIDINQQVRERLVVMAGGDDAFTCVPLQGSGTFAVEAMLATFLPRDGKLLILINGAYGHRIATICDYLGRQYVTYETSEVTPPDAAEVDTLLKQDASITHVAIIHCETTSGILNPLGEIAETVAKHNRRLLVDSMSAFGALEIDVAALPCEAMAASSNKCIEGAPGIGFVICRTDALGMAKENSHSLSLDLHNQWEVMESNAQWRFTPPTHVMAAFHQALIEHAAEGGVTGRGARYRRNCDVLIKGMSELGFVPLLPERLRAPIIITFHMPADTAFVFQEFYDRLSKKGYIIYPGKLTVAESFRVGCIGRIDETVIRGALVAMGETLDEMGVRDCGLAQLA